MNSIFIAEHDAIQSPGSQFPKAQLQVVNHKLGIERKNFFAHDKITLVNWIA